MTALGHTLSSSTGSGFSALPPSWAQIFGNTNPVEVEIGPGHGSFLMALARRHPERNFFGVEFASRRVFQAARRLERDGSSNVIIVRADIGCLCRTHIYPESVQVYHFYFPDPWWKKRHHRLRVVQADFPTALTRTLAPGGSLLFASDVRPYFEQIVEQFGRVAGLDQFAWRRDQLSHRGKPIVTDFERKYQCQGRAIYYTGFRKRR